MNAQPIKAKTGLPSRAHCYPASLPTAQVAPKALQPPQSHRARARISKGGLASDQSACNVQISGYKRPSPCSIGRRLHLAILISLSLSLSISLSHTHSAHLHFRAILRDLCASSECSCTLTPIAQANAWGVTLACMRRLIWAPKRLG